MRGASQKQVTSVSHLNQFEVCETAAGKSIAFLLCTPECPEGEDNGCPGSGTWEKKVEAFSILKTFPEEPGQNVNVVMFLLCMRWLAIAQGIGLAALSVDRMNN